MPKPTSGKDMRRFAQEVADLGIQGATAIGRATLDAIVQAAGSVEIRRTGAWKELERQAELLSQIRPTEPLARNLARWFVFNLKLARRRLPDVDWLDLCDQAAQDIRYRLEKAEAGVVTYGQKLVRANQTIFTHCHSSLAEGILVAARRKRRRFSVYHTETRPRFQGRITAESLKRHGIPATMVVDSAAPWLISNHSGDDVKVDWVLLGADSIGRDGSILNKIGSFGIALSAHDSKLPVYVAATVLKTDWGGESRIERRRVDEVWAGAPKGVRLVNYAFDRVPPEYLTGFITEFGLVKPRQVGQLARRHYPWLIR